MLANGAHTASDMMGGTFYQITGDADPFFQRIVVASSGVYRLAVEAPKDTAPGRDFTLSARLLKKDGLTVRANRHAVAANPADATTATAAPTPAPTRTVVPPEEQMKRAILTGRALTGIDVAISRALRRAADPSQVSIDVAVTVGASAKGPIKTTFGLVDPGGAIRTSDKTLEPPEGGAPYRLSFSIPVAPGAYKLRFAALDAGGAVGAAEAVVDAKLAAMGPLLASDVIVEPLPGASKRLLGAIELYPSGDAPSDLLVKFALMGGGPDPLVERVAVPEAVDGVLRAEAEFALDRFGAGDYSIHATVMSGATVLGTATSRR
jgi:hypothetical protein